MTLKELKQIDITIKNLRKEKPSKPYQVKVDHSSPLGNPFYMKKFESEVRREHVCWEYDMYFHRMVNNNIHDIVVELERLLSIYQKYGKLELFCWCYPKKCHAETIKLYLIKKVKEIKKYG